MNLIKDRDGKVSSKRAIGLTMVVAGLVEKVTLFLYTIDMETAMINFSGLDKSADTLIYAGSTLIGASAIEFLSKKK